MSKSPVAIIILDGFGWRPEVEGNAVAQANKPNFDRYYNEFPHTTLKASGLDVGLPDGQMGNSEVGHTNIGAGRIVYQSLTRIDKAILDGEFDTNPALNGAFNHVLENGSALHLFGLLSDGGVHSHINHLLALIETAKAKGISKVYVHAFMDGRDVDPKAGPAYIKTLEENGVGRPSTYAPTISTIQQRDYVHKGDRKGEERKYAVDSLLGLKITSKTKKEMAGADKGKLIPTDIGMVVNDFLMENFPEIMDYNFTAKVEQEFDKIAEGKAEWNKEMKVFYQGFEPEVEKVMNARSEHKAGERELGIDPATGKPVFVKIGRFGPVVQIGTADDEDKPRFSQLPSDKSMETITLDEALELFKLPRTVGQFEGTDVVIGAGRFGPYVLHNKKYVSLPKDENPMTITLDAAINLIQKKRLQEAQRHLKTFEEDANMEVMNGRYGPYIAYNGKNYRMPKALHEKASELTYEQCMDIVNNAPEPKRKK